MKRLYPAVGALLLGLALMTLSMMPAMAERRVALVVGNAQYNISSLLLTNPKNDAEDVTAALTVLGFQVIQVTNANRREFDLSMAKFARLATDADAALFYYAGHALQFQGRNYLMPTDAEVEDEVSLRYQMVPIDDVRVALDRASGVKIMILDACRNNPVVETLRRKSSGETRAIGATRGLARIDKTQGMVVAYSTASDAVAADGKGRNSPFTGAFLKRLKEPGLEIEQLFRRVASDVNSETQGRQRPETYVSLLSDYYINQTDRIAFDAVRDSGDVNALRNFVIRFPTSSYVSDAMSRIQSIDAAIQQRQILQARQEEAARQAEQQRRAAQDLADRQASEQRAEQERRSDAQRLAERQAAERQAAERRQAEQKAAADAAEKLRLGNEAAVLSVKGAVKNAAPELRPSTTMRRDEPPAKSVGLDRPEARLPADSPPAASSAAVPPATSDQDCNRDRARLAKLRGNPVRDDIILFERELSCERLRPQVVRLRESMLPLDTPAATPSVDVATAPPPQPQLPVSTVRPPAANAAQNPPLQPPPPELTAVKPIAKPSILAVGDPAACEKDAARLARLRANPSLAELGELERNLGCERLRLQIVRLRESLPPETASAEIASRATPPVAAAVRDMDANGPKVRMAPAPPVVSCDQERGRLVQLRANQSRDEVVKFERELVCEQLRPQVMRLRESLSGG